MWIVSADGKVSDPDLIALSKLLSVLDAARTEIDRVLEGHTEESPHMEEWDDFAGLGFVACQRYLTIVMADLGIEGKAKEVALTKGPCATSGAPIVRVINSAANAWKHEPEYKDPLQPRQSAALENLESHLGDPRWWYKFANALYDLSPDSRFAGILPALEAWRDELRAESTLGAPPMPYWLEFGDGLKKSEDETP